MRTVYKYEVPPAFEVEDDGKFTLQLPQGAKVVHFGYQHGEFCIWMLVDPEAEVTQREFWVAGTGHPVLDGVKHTGTAMTDDGAFVFHLFIPV